MLRALKDLVPDLEKVVKLQYVSQLLYVKLSLGCFTSFYIFYFCFYTLQFVVQKKLNPQKRYVQTTVFNKTL